MGVHGLWRLIEPSGKPVPLETLENKTLAVDISIWLHQAVKGFQDSKGAPVANAHLLGVYHRVCKLLYFKIKPVFVFDGGVPALKRQTIAKRTQQKHKTQNEADRLHKNLLESILKHTALSKVLSEKTKAEITTHTTSPGKKSKDETESLFFLPPTTSTSFSDEEETLLSDSSEDSPTKHWDLHTIDTESAQFKSLPVDVRHEILIDLKETRKQNSWGRLHELPTVSDDFSVFQMQRLLKRQAVQAALEKAEQEMGGHSLSLAELEKLMNDQGVITSENITGRIASDENTRYLLIKDLKQAVEEAKKLQAIEEEEEIEEIKQSEVEIGECSTTTERNKADVEFESELQQAIALSLMDLPSTSSSRSEESRSKSFQSFQDNVEDSDWSTSEDEELQIVQNFSSAQSYMKEYSGLTPHEIAKIISSKTLKKKSKSGIEKSNKVIEENEPQMNGKNGTEEETMEQEIDCSKNITIEDINEHPEVTEKAETLDIEDSDSSEDFIEVKTEHNESLNAMEVVIKPDEQLEDDLFADIFAKDEETTASESVATITKSIEDPKAETNKEISSKQNLNKHETLLEPSKNILNTESKSKEEEPMKIDRPESSNIQIKDKEKTQDQITPAPKLTVQQMEEMRTELRKEQLELESEKSTKDRLAGNITDQMYQETQELLELFGVPYIIAPMEAEAQCAFLDLIRLTDGTITDDSDIWLFGGRTVYKNFFNQSKHVLEYRSENIEKNFRLTRQQMILLAMLVGSDYTIGLPGVGPVTALEILAAFPSKTNFLLSGLSEFRQWWDKGKLPGPRRTSLRTKLKNLAFIENFPNPQIVTAYLEPQVETSDEKFTWGQPDTPALIDFTRRKFGWTRKKTEEILNPVLKKLQETTSQTTIRDYFKTVSKVDSTEVESKLSKRVKTAVKRIGTEPTEGEEVQEPKPRKQRKKKNQNPEDEDLKVLKETKVKSKKRVKEIDAELKKDLEKTTAQKKKTIAERLHQKEVIPQKQKDKADLLRNKLKAIETFRKSKKGPGFLKKRPAEQTALKEDAGYLSESSCSD